MFLYIVYFQDILLVNNEPERVKYIRNNKLQEIQRMKRNTVCPKHECWNSESKHKARNIN